MSIEEILIDLTVAIDANTQAITAQTAAEHGVTMENPHLKSQIASAEGVSLSKAVNPDDYKVPEVDDTLLTTTTWDTKTGEVKSVETVKLGNDETAPQDADGASDVSAEVDKDGVIWDKRIHSSNEKIVVASGKWARRRNITDELYAQVTTELQGYAADTNSTEVTTAPVVAAPAPAPDPVISAPVETIPRTFPEPVDAENPTHPECEDIMFYFKEFHGAALSSECLEAWKMKTLADLPEILRVSWVAWMRGQDEENK